MSSPARTMIAFHVFVNYFSRDKDFKLNFLNVLVMRFFVKRDKESNGMVLAYLELLWMEGVLMLR
jgi:hypothetical protein